MSVLLFELFREWCYVFVDEFNSLGFGREFSVLVSRVDTVDESIEIRVEAQHGVDIA
jgi:hypothetical protein